MPGINKDFSKRATKLMHASGIKNPHQLAKRLNRDPATVLKYMNEGRVPRADILLEIADELHTTVEYLLAGRSRASTSPHIIQFQHENPEIVSEAAAEERLDSFIPVRILADSVSMGPGMRVSDGATGGYAVIHEDAIPKIARSQKRDDEKIVCLWAKGDSMEPTIQHGALVAVDLRETEPMDAENRKIYVVWLPEGGITLKRVVRRDDHLILIADNPEAADFPRTLIGKDVDKAIRGKVIWWWSKQD